MGHEATERTRKQIDRAEEVYRRRGTVLRAAWAAAGFLVVAAGLAMVVVPGPVTVVVPAGLAMLSAVFGWARRLLLAGVDTSVEAKERIQSASTTAKALGAAALACLSGAAVVGMAALLA